MTGEGRPRRERDKDAKQARIFAAARDLFEEQGFAAVTTQQIAERADVAAGTVFRFAATKAELLLMVYNVTLAEAIAAGLAAAASASGAAAVAAAVAPLVRAAATARDMTAYQRELLFGTGADRYREEGLALIAGFEQGLARIIEPDDPARGRPAAQTVFAAVHLALVQPELRATPDRALARLRVQIDQIVAGHTVTMRTHGGDTRLGRKGTP